ncbi:carboxypeptidase-like regulatory domain-containing protein [Planctomycetes bacterium Poly30]|uniref:carboxypeptidase-like regulatory domain-containing protein n=1 Tax=Saltatorellus ferox TaxID=2528018 RepID=UPI0011A97791
MKSSARIPILLAVVLGLSLIVFGLLRTASEGAIPATESSGDSVRAGDSSGRDFGPAAPDARIPPMASRGSATDSEPLPDEADETFLQAKILYVADRKPAAEARVGLWRAQSGAGPSYRPARRLTELSTDADGLVRFIVPPGVPLELLARSEDQGPPARLEVGILARGETRAVQLSLERPPAPLGFRVFDAASGEPITGAAIRSVTFDQSHLGLEDFPGTTRLIQRTDGSGEVELPGEARDTRWLLVDAAGYSPVALDATALEGRTTAEVGLMTAASLTVEVVDASGAVLRDIEVTLQADLGGYRTTFTAITNRLGETTFRQLPVHTPLVPSAGAVEEIPGLFDAITLTPGETRTLRLELAIQ